MTEGPSNLRKRVMKRWTNYPKPWKWIPRPLKKTGKPLPRWWTYLELNWFSYVVNWAMAKAPNTMVIVRNIFIDPLGHSLSKRQRPSPYARPWSKRTKSMSSIGVVLMLLRWRRFLSHHPLGGREFVWGRLFASPLKELLILLFWKPFGSIVLDVRTVKNFESKLDQKPQLHWRLVIPGVDRVPGKWLRRPNNNGCYEDSRQCHIKQWDW